MVAFAYEYSIPLPMILRNGGCVLNNHTPVPVWALICVDRFSAMILPFISLVVGL
jgi:hypothetical protein